MTQEESDRVSVLLVDAHRALDEAWRILDEAGDVTNRTRLMLATERVTRTADELGFSVKA